MTTRGSATRRVMTFQWTITSMCLHPWAWTIQTSAKRLTNTRWCRCKRTQSHVCFIHHCCASQSARYALTETRQNARPERPLSSCLRQAGLAAVAPGHHAEDLPASSAVAPGELGRAACAAVRSGRPGAHQSAAAACSAWAASPRELLKEHTKCVTAAAEGRPAAPVLPWPGPPQPSPRPRCAPAQPAPTEALRSVPRGAGVGTIWHRGRASVDQTLSGGAIYFPFFC